MPSPIITRAVILPAYPQFTMLVVATGSSFTLPTDGASTYDYTINWGDGNIQRIGVNSSQTHSYPTANQYVVKISGNFPAIKFNNAGDKVKLLQVQSLGNCPFNSFNAAFYGCTAMTSFNARTNANTGGCTSTNSMFRSCSGCKFFDLGGMVTSKVTDMGSMFNGATQLVGSIPYIDTSGATLMGSFFNGCTSLNAPVDVLNTTNVTDMSSFFNGCSAFNKPVNTFNTANVTTFASMFLSCSVFNQAVSNWNTSSATIMSAMFESCSQFNQSVSNFNTANVTTLSNMFTSCTSFNQDTSGWSTSSATTFASMFANCHVFNQNLSGWNTSSATTFASMFSSAMVFNCDVSSWVISNMTSAATMFTSSAFNETNYNLLLVGWQGQSHHNSVTFSAGTAQYSAPTSAPATARAALVSNSWTITDGGPD